MSHEFGDVRDASAPNTLSGFVTPARSPINMKSLRRPLVVLTCKFEKRPSKLATEACVLSGKYGELWEAVIVLPVYPRKRCLSQFTIVQRTPQLDSHRLARAHHFDVFVFLVAVDQESAFDFGCPIAAECTEREPCVGFLGYCCSARDGKILEVAGDVLCGVLCGIAQLGGSLRGIVLLGMSSWLCVF